MSTSLADRLRHWGPRALLSLADQGLFSLTTFVVNVLLARWLVPAAYGAFALAFAIFLFLGALHTALLTEPMLVLGAGRFRGEFRQYLGFLLRGHMQISLLGSALLALVALLAAQLNAPLLANALYGVAIAAPFILLPWLLRRAFYVEAQPSWAAVGSGLYLALTVLGLLWLRDADQLSAFSAYAVMGLAALVISFLLLAALKPQRSTKSERTAMRAPQWDYARWAALSAVLIWVPLNIFYLAIPYASDLSAAGVLRALSNTLTPLTQSVQALVVLLLPQLAARFQERGKVALDRHLRQLLLVFLAASGVYWLLLALFRTTIVDVLYAGQYAEYASLLPLAGLVPVAMGASSLLGSGLRAMEMPERVVRPYLFGAAFALTGGVYMTITYGVGGAFAGQGLAYLFMALMLARQLARA